MWEKQRFPTYPLQKSVRKEFYGRKGRLGPSTSTSLKITVQTRSCCWAQSGARVLLLSQPEQRFGSGSQHRLRGLQWREQTPRVRSLKPGSNFHLSWGLVGSTVTKLLWKERGERDHEQKEQMKFAFYIWFLLRELLL